MPLIFINEHLCNVLLLNYKFVKTWHSQNEAKFLKTIKLSPRQLTIKTIIKTVSSLLSICLNLPSSHSNPSTIYIYIYKKTLPSRMPYPLHKAISLRSCRALEFGAFHLQNWSNRWTNLLPHSLIIYYIYYPYKGFRSNRNIVFLALSLSLFLLAALMV